MGNGIYNFRMKKCIVCKKDFSPTSNRQIICGDECREIRKVEHAKAFQERRRIKKGLSLYADCVICGVSFFKGDGSGKHKRSTCSDECHKKRQAQWSREDIKRRKEKNNICIIKGCRKTAVRTRNTLCEAHYYQNRRTGSFNKKIYPKTADHGSYVRILGSHVQNHPMRSKKSNMLYEHRMVAYDSRNGICDDCFWCGKELTWESCVIDHLNEDKHDNRPDNLLVSCPRCNRGRGAMLNLISYLKPEVMDIFYKAIEDYRARHGKFKK